MEPIIALFSVRHVMRFRPIVCRHFEIRYNNGFCVLSLVVELLKRNVYLFYFMGLKLAQCQTHNN